MVNGAEASAIIHPGHMDATLAIRVHGRIASFFQILDFTSDLRHKVGALTNLRPTYIVGLNLPPISAIERAFGVCVVLLAEVRHA